MSLTHLHLLLNHFPVIGAIIGSILLVVALMRRNGEITKVAFGLFVGLGIVAGIVFLTGEPAEEAIESLPGFSESLTERHEEAAAIAMMLLGAFAVFTLGVLLRFRQKEIPRWLTVAGLFLSLVSTSAMSYTAMLGGQVRHTEVRSDFIHQDADQGNPD